MHTHTASPAPLSLTPTQTHHADAARYATSTEAKAENARQIAALASEIEPAYIVEHIRGMVATTAAHLSIDATTTQDHATLWQRWALGVADGVERGEPAQV